MASKLKKIGAAGRFGSRIGVRPRQRFNAVESQQRKKQMCPHCNKLGVKRVSTGIWSCPKCNRTFANHAYALARA